MPTEPEILGPEQPTLSWFLTRMRARLIVLAGSARMLRIDLDQHRLTLGRGPGVDLAFDDPHMARVQAAFEFVGDGFQIRSLDETAPIYRNGIPTTLARLQPGDRLALGSRVLEYAVRAAPRPRTARWHTPPRARPASRTG